MRATTQSQHWGMTLGEFKDVPRYDQIRKVVSEILRENFVGEPPVLIDEIAENYGLSVFRTKFPDRVPKVVGVLNLKEHLISVSEDDAPNRQTFTVAHELGHYVLHKRQIENNPRYQVVNRTPLGVPNEDAIETEANYFAAQILMPTKMITQLDNLTNAELATIFAVSPEAIGYRLKDERIRAKRIS